MKSVANSHTFRVDKPMVSSRNSTVIENIYRLEVPGSSGAHWVRVSINPAKPVSLFEADPAIVRECKKFGVRRVRRSDPVTT